jgi:hypothetical protein
MWPFTDALIVADKVILMDENNALAWYDHEAIESVKPIVMALLCNVIKHTKVLTIEGKCFYPKGIKLLLEAMHLTV